MTDKVNVDRRTLLKSAAVSVTAGFGLAGASATAAAQPGRPAAREEAEELFARHGRDLLSLLSAEGVLDRGEIAELVTDVPAQPGTVAANREGTALLALPDEADRLVSVTEVTDGTLSVMVEPDTGRSYATLEDGDSLTVFDPEVGRVEDRDVSTESHCSNYPCGDGCYEESTLSYQGREVNTQACCSYYTCTGGG